MQNDFISGSLALPEAADSIAPVNFLLSNLATKVVTYSLDWHPANHISFHSNLQRYQLVDIETDKSAVNVFDTVEFAGPPPFNQTLWPDHCVQGSNGAKLDNRVKVKHFFLNLNDATTKSPRQCGAILGAATEID